jgi:two-component system, NtrC family, sensor kinase
MGRGQKPAKSKEAKPPVAHKSSKNGAARVSDLEKRLAEALRDKAEAQEQQAATAEILQAMRRSPADTQPVFDAIVSAAARLLRADGGILTRVAGELIELAAFTSSGPAGDEGLRAGFPVSVHGTGSMQAITVRGPAPFVSTDFGTDERLNEGTRRRLAARGFRSGAAVPLIDKGISIGALSVTRRDPGAFAPDEIALLKTFADQAVIAIENVRLFKELESRNAALTEALNQQTATAEILSVISASPTQVQPVFDAIVASAVRLCNGVHGAILRVDGNTLDHVAQFGHETAVLEEIRRHFPQPIDYARPSSPLRAIRERRVVEVTDTETTPGVPDFIREAARRQGFRSELWVPMLHGENAIGTIVVTRREPGRFTDKQIALLRTFADQAVIAIENVRLFKELQEKNQALTIAHAQVSETLEQQTATSEILRTISTSPTDLQPVLDAIATSAARLLEAEDVGIIRVAGDLLRLVAGCGPVYTAWGPGTAIPLSRGSVSGRAVIDRTVMHIRDLAAVSREEYPVSLDLQRQAGVRTVVAAPLICEGTAIGLINVFRRQVRPFTELHTRWSARAWLVVRVEFRRALALRSEIRRAGWFN